MVLILVLSGSALAGVPLQSGEPSCGMDHVMADMDCCQLALMPGGGAQVATARLCCALYCPKEGTSPVNEARFAPQLQLTVVSYPPVSPATLTSRLTNRLIGSSHDPPGDSNPAYIRNLTLLI